MPVFYWVDIFAVTQHFSGDFKDHPDSDFPGVIRAAKVSRHVGLLLQFSQYTAYRTACWPSVQLPTRVPGYAGYRASMTAPRYEYPDWHMLILVSDGSTLPVCTCAGRRPVFHGALAQPAIRQARVVPVRGADGAIHQQRHQPAHRPLRLHGKGRHAAAALHAGGFPHVYSSALDDGGNEVLAQDQRTDSASVPISCPLRTRYSKSILHRTPVCSRRAVALFAFWTLEARPPYLVHTVSTS